MEMPLADLLTTIQNGFIESFHQEWMNNHASKFTEKFEKAVRAGRNTITYTTTTDDFKHPFPHETRIAYLKKVLCSIYEPSDFDIWMYVTTALPHQQTIAIEVKWKRHVC